MRVPTKGSLSETSFISILKDSAAANLTGMIRLENGTIIKVVYLQGGSIAFASSNEKTDRLTEVLKRAEKLTPEQVEDAQARLKPNVSLGKTLVELGYISARDLLWGARAQVEGILHKLLFWKDGSYQVLEGPLPKEIIGLNLSAAQIIYDGVLTIKDREWLLNEIGSPEAIYVLGSDFHEKNAIYKLPADSVVSLMDGKRSLEEIAQQSGLDTFETCKIAAALQQLGLIEKAPEKPVQLEFPEEATPVTQVMEEPIVEELAPTVIQSPSADVSLGQVLHVPTMDELEADGHQAAAPTLVAEMPQVKTPSPAPAAPTIKETVAPPIAPVIPAANPYASASPPKTRLEPPLFVTKKKRKSGSPLMWFTGHNRDWTRILAIAMIPIALGVAGWVYYNRTRPIPAEETLKITPAPPISLPEPKPSNAMPAEQETKQGAAQPIVVPEDPRKSAAPPATTQEASPITMARLGKLPQAAMSWKQKLTQNRNKFTIQLEIACQEKTVFDALQLVDYSQEILVVPMNFKGRPCYRVLYGIYPNTSDGRAARNDLPSEFLNQPSPPQVVSIRKILQ